MKISCLLLLCLALANCYCIAQSHTAPQPLIIQGQLTNCQEEYLFLGYEDEYFLPQLDTIRLDKEGRFYLKTYRVTKPVQASIQHHRTQINDIFIAPGYELTITGDAADPGKLYAAKKITGKGAESNRYRLLLDSILVARNDTVGWYDKTEAALVAYVKDFKALKDSLAYVVFDRKATNDPYLPYFGKTVRMDNLFNSLYLLMAYADIHGFDYARSQAFVQQHADTSLLNNLFRREYMQSYIYRTWVLSEYLSYSERLEKLKSKDGVVAPNYKTDKVLNTFQGVARQLVLYRVLNSQAGKCNSFEAVKEFNNKNTVYLDAVTTPAYTAALDKRLAERTVELARTQIGKPAPPFTLQSSTGKTWSLADFKGKVVYMDLWASWCGPCRAETPALKKLHSKYRNNDSVAIISISVSDGRKEWEKALAEDQPEWLQLLDKDNTVGSLYVARMIPQFVLIDKQGHIVSNSAPFPSDGEKVEKLLAQELAR